MVQGTRNRVSPDVGHPGRAPASVGPRDMVRADGSYDWQVIKTLARRRASAEVEKVERWIAQGLMDPECRTSLRGEFRAALNYYYRDMAKIAWQLHPVNRGKVAMATIVPFGRPAPQRVRMSEF